ncbi:uncharacterized protein LOC112466111 [Temnothorax curvispinosus]|uniref:Uncharacterized protein LOC112466111 n=1 Tax=Temnothorax curvispinosus TaxID=300111 RepID=A0A6J1R3Z4_9HYME|nr:uncharacterized protein LOC112466111 [Temnothorax curvispinosus]
MRLSHVENYLELQFTMMGMIEKTSDNLISVGRSNITLTMVQTRLTDLKENWDQFSMRHQAIGLAVRSLNAEDRLLIMNHAYFSEGLFPKTHQIYLREIDRLNSILAREPESVTPSNSTQPVSRELGSVAPLTSTQPVSREPVSETSSNLIPPPVNILEAQSLSDHLAYLDRARLPIIKLPEFDGTPDRWLSFKDLFTSIILNTSLTAVEKLQYLKTSLKGSAALLLKNTKLTADNFQKSWEALVAFYENTRLLVNETIQSLFSLKRMTKESATEMEQLYTNMTQIYRTLETLQRPVETWDDILVFIAVQRLDANSVKAWEIRLGSAKQPPTWDQIRTFMFDRFHTLQAVERNRSGFRSLQSTAASHFQGKSKDEKTGKSNSCVLCSAKHYIAHCSQYTSKTVQQRMAIIAKHKLCYNCLGLHRASACRVTTRCLKCGNKHHTTIHQFNKKSTNSDQSSTKAETKAVSSPTIKTDQAAQSTSTNSDVKTVHAASISRSTSSVLLATAQIVIESHNGERIKARALIDQGSEISLITERLVQRLRLPRKHSIIPLIGIGAQKARQTRGVVTFKMKPHFESEYECFIDAHILPKLTTSLPSKLCDSSTWIHLIGLQYADPDFTIPGSIDIILGADIYGIILEEGIIKGALDTPIAQRTKLGWIISGPAGNASNSFLIRSNHISTDKELYDLIQRFWEMERIPISENSSLSEEDQQCELHFQSTHTRDSSGRYQVKLPFSQPAEKLGDSRTKAVKVLNSLSKRLLSDPQYEKAYHKFMDDYKELQHMTLVPDSCPEPQHVYYLPHHGVLRDNDLNRIRVVFNGSSRTSTGYSLNDILFTGAKLQINLFDVLIWWRRFPFVFSFDMMKMYRQILIHPDDRDLQRILWILQSKGILTIQTFQLNTVTYGEICAPFLALRTIIQLIKDEGSKYPLAVPVLKKGRYMDDGFGGSDSIKKARSIVQEVTEICNAGGFPLHKWSANHPEILDSIPPDKQAISSPVKINENALVNTLGLCWNPPTDTFHFTIEIPKPNTLSKRTVMSVIAKIFDPLGLLAPVLIPAKVLIQELWTLKLGWDDPLPGAVSTKWNQFVNKLQEKHKIAIPRWIGVTSDHHIEIHGFCDASQQAIAAAVYVRSTDAHGVTKVSLLCAKTKVAPLKRLTIARLELEGAVLMTKLISQVSNILEWDRVPVTVWLDSSIAKTWITGHPSRWKDFVHNRVVFIQKTLPHAQWRFVSGKENPADCATRGLTPVQVQEFTTWWQGPHWLSASPSTWPNEVRALNIEDNLEERPMKVVTISKDYGPELWELAHRYSDLTRLLRITATCMRAIARFRRSNAILSETPLTPQELNHAKLFWIKAVQQVYFKHDLQTLSSGRSLDKTSPLLRLTPKLDSDGFLRVGGRLHSAFLPINTKHPFILPKDSPFTALIIADAHLRTMHGGTQLTTNFIRTEYWIIGGRAPIRSFILKCIRCARFRQKRAQQIMAPLPIENLTPSRAFLHSGVDYAGPFVLKTWRGRNPQTYKAYIALFVCHATSAIHLELVTDYTTDAFIAAYKRFTARRGICATLMSDCGTNFQGADSELKRLFSSSSEELGNLAMLLANHGTQWKFNPPSAPHFGGKWEAGVRSVKFHLKRVVGDNLLTFEEMSTWLTQIEATLNSRPLCPLTDDPNDLNALTPGHFLIGGAPTIIPEPSLEAVKVARLSRWQLIRQMLDSFWTRWSSECLQRYLSIYKWNKATPSLKVGSLVLVVDERYPPSKWPLGRIIETFPGSDGYTRVVSVRTQHAVLKRPIVKVCPLPIESDVV